jgi:hypothetical protein
MAFSLLSGVLGSVPIRFEKKAELSNGVFEHNITDALASTRPKATGSTRVGTLN